MKIVCSAEKGELEHTECLACSLQGSPPCGYGYALLKSMLGSDEQEKRANEIHVTDLTGCLRKSWYSKTERHPEYIHETMARWIGSGLHEFLDASDEHVDSELKVEWDGIVGKADIVYKSGLLVDTKTTRWMYPDKLPYGSHALQVNIYAWMLRKMGRDINALKIQYIDASGPSKCRSCKVPVRMIGGELLCPKCLKAISGAHLGAMLVDIQLMSDSEVESIVLPRKETLMMALEMGIAPEQEPGWLCNYCGHFDFCQPKGV